MEQVSEQAVAGSGGGRRARRRKVGRVVSDVRDKTIKVLVDYQLEHAKYGKQIRRRTSVHAHDPANEARVGDRVLLMECRPISKTKHWRLERIVQRAPRGGEQPVESKAQE